MVEGEITPPQYPIIPGHQVVGEIEALGEEVSNWEIGEYAGIPWLFKACGNCEFCERGEENLCAAGEFTGFHRNGGYAEYMLADARYALRVPEPISPQQIAPLLCAGIIGYRSLHKADLSPGETLGLVGFGASAHIAIQIAQHWGCQVYVFTRDTQHRNLASSLGAEWVGGSEEDPPSLIDRIVLFAPVGDLVPVMLQKLRPGGTLAINAIHLSPIPKMSYDRIYLERTLRSVANATYQDGVELIKLAEEIPIRPSVQSYSLLEVNQALLDLKQSRIQGAGVLIP
jgi:propanol-preferring alcohol dehydrogenase